jgi:hypothetical protein
MIFLICYQTKMTEKHPAPEENTISECIENEPDWYRDGDAWVKLFLEPIAPGKFKQHDYIYNVPGENDFPKERWSSAECKDGFHITRRKDVWAHLELHGYKSAYIAEVVSMGEELYDNPDQLKRKVRVVAFGPAVPLTEVLGKHQDDFEDGEMMAWSVKNNHFEMAKLVGSNNPDSYAYGTFEIALENGNDRIADYFIEKCESEEGIENMFWSAITRGRVDFVERLVEKTSVRVIFFKTACAYGQFEIFQLLCANIRSRGVDMSDFGMFVHACSFPGLRSNANAVEYLVSEGADVKHPLIAYIANSHGDEEAREVREYLLFQIDDKSKVPMCEDLENEISEICYTFRKRIEAGEFDGE